MLGAYGYRLEHSSPWLQEAPDSAPLLSLEQRVGTPDVRATWTTDSVALRSTAGGWLVGSPSSVTCWVPEAVDDSELVHPRLAGAASVCSAWRQQLALHGAAVATSYGAVALLGDRESGKSTTAHAVAAAGHPVLADDLVLLEDGDVLTGPRCLDRRTPPGTPVRRGTRWRQALPTAPWRLPLVGVVLLAWGDSLLLEPVPVTQRARTWQDHRTVPGLPADPAQVLALLGVPWWRLTRPRRVDLLGACVEVLLHGPPAAARPGAAGRG